VACLSPVELVVGASDIAGRSDHRVATTDHASGTRRSASVGHAAEALSGSGDVVASVEPSGSELGLWPEAVRIFASLEARSLKPASALAQVRELQARNPSDFHGVLLRCASVLVEGVEALRVCTRAVDAALDLLASASEGVVGPSGSPIAVHILSWLVEALGGDGSSGRRSTPRDKGTRCNGTKLVGRLLPLVLATPEAVPHGLLESVEFVLVQLSRDRAPPVRLAAVAGLSIVGTPAAEMVLRRLATTDAASAVRVTALQHAVTFTAGGKAASYLAAVPLSRGFDVAPSVRRCLFNALGGLGEEDGTVVLIARAAAGLIRRGLNDVSQSVRKACQRMLLAWLTCLGSGTNALLLLLECLDVEANEDVAEAIVRCVAVEPDWRPLLEEEASRVLPANGAEFGREQVLLWRLSSMIDGGADRCISALGLAPFIARVQHALRMGHTFELRQLLMVLASSSVLATLPMASPKDESGCDSGCGRQELLQVAMEVLTRGPLCDAHCGSSAISLALVVVRRALGARGHTLCQLSRRSDTQFFHAVSRVLQVLREPSRSGEYFAGTETSSNVAPHMFPDLEPPPEASEGLDAAGFKFDELLIELRQGARLEHLLTRLDPVQEELVSLTARALRIAEEALAQLSNSCVEECPLEELSQAWLRPTLVRADAAEGVIGGTRWASLRASAVRCLALHTSLCPEVAITHWQFFLVVLERYGPVVLEGRGGEERPAGAVAPADSREAAAAAAAVAVASTSESIVESCVLFLTDTLLAHRRAGPGGGAGEAEAGEETIEERSRKLFEVLAAHVLGFPGTGGGAASPRGAAAPPCRRSSPPPPPPCRLPPRLRRRVAERLCALLFFGGAPAAAPPAPGEDVKEEEEEEEEDDEVPPRPPWRCGAGAAAAGARWALTWLLLEAFCLPPPPQPTKYVEEEQVPAEAAEEAAHRGRLLRFFSCLAQASPAHAALLAASAEGVLATELWRLGAAAAAGRGAAAAPPPRGPRRRWCPLQLPRLLRFLGRRLAACGGGGSGGGGPAAEAGRGEGEEGGGWGWGHKNVAARLWLECVWRPLVLLCLEAPAEQQQPLAEALLAAPPAALETAAGGGVWGDALVEVAHALGLVLARWGLGAGGGNSAGGVGGGASAGGVDGAVASSLLRLAARLSAGVPPAAAAATEAAWPRLLIRVRHRCGRLRNTFEVLGVDAAAVVRAASAAAAAAAEVRHPSAVAAPFARRCSLRRRSLLSSANASASKGVAKTAAVARRARARRARRKSRMASDDDSDQPSPKRARLPSRSPSWHGDGGACARARAQGARPPSLGGC